MFALLFTLEEFLHGLLLLQSIADESLHGYFVSATNFYADYLSMNSDSIIKLLKSIIKPCHNFSCMFI